MLQTYAHENYPFKSNWINIFWREWPTLNEKKKKISNFFSLVLRKYIFFFFRFQFVPIVVHPRTLTLNFFCSHILTAGYCVCVFFFSFMMPVRLQRNSEKNCSIYNRFEIGMGCGATRGLFVDWSYYWPPETRTSSRGIQSKMPRGAQTHRVRTDRRRENRKKTIGEVVTSWQ